MLGMLGTTLQAWTTLPRTKKGSYHGLNFCAATVSEMLGNVGREIYDLIHYFGSRGKTSTCIPFAATATIFTGFPG